MRPPRTATTHQATDQDLRGIRADGSESSCSDSDAPRGFHAHRVDATELSASSLFYLFADRVLDPLTDKWRRLALGVPVPCADTQVDMFSWAQLLLASAFWGLQTRGVIDLELVQLSTNRRNSGWRRLRRRKGNGSADVIVDVVREAPLSGLEGAVMTNLEVGDRISVGAQIGQWLGTPRTDACMRVIAAASDEAASRGLCEPVEGSNSTYARWLDRTAHTCFESARDQIAALEPDLYETVAQWNAFAAAEPDLCCDLLHTCFAAVRERQ